VRIVVYCPHYEDPGGVREVARRLIAAAIGAGHEVHVVTRRRRGSRVQDVEATTGAALWRGKLLPVPHRGAGWRARRRFARRFPATAWRLARHVRRLAPDVVATHCSKFHAPWVMTLRAATRAPVVVHLHNAAQTADGPESPLLSRLLLRCAARIIAVSPDVAAYARACVPRRAARVAWIPNGIDPDEIGPRPPAERPRPYVLGVGRLARQKGFDLLIDAVLAAELDMDLVLVGDGPDRTALEKRARAGGGGGRVHFLGAVDRDTVARLMAGAAIFAMPSRFEGHPLVCLEAMQAGAPIVASAIPGLPVELQDGENVLLFPSEDVAALGARLKTLAAAPERARALGRAAQATARRLSAWHDVTARVLSIYTDVARRGAAAPDHTRS
jgi:glycosyltransferase involved in cell wall biosynthesis